MFVRSDTNLNKAIVDTLRLQCVLPSPPSQTIPFSENVVPME